VTKQEDWIIIGRFGRPHGIKGLVTINSFTEPRDNILSYSNWHAFINQSWQPVKILSAQIYNKTIVAQIEGYPEREIVARLTNIDIAVHGDQLASLEPGEYYWHQLVGMNVINREGQAFGEVIEVMATGSNDVLVVQGERRHLIPYIPGTFIIDINNNNKIITVDWDMDF
jgi:16S rRNA processing protein RimM